MDGHPKISTDAVHNFAHKATSAPAGTLGFGCASLYALPSAQHRRALLETAYELGIRHFDVAPTYGLGIAEKELADFLHRRTDVTVATKFGLRPSVLGRIAGATQHPIRQGLARLPTLQAKMRGVARQQEPGVLDRILYTERDYSVAAARRSLSDSLRALRRDHIDYFLMHEPAGHPSAHGEIVEYLERCRGEGLIGSWGPAGDLSRMDTGLEYLCDHAGVQQFPYDLILGAAGRAAAPHLVTYGFISAALPRVEQALANSPALTRHCTELLDADLTDRRTVIRLLTRDAVRNNPFGTVLASTTKPEHLRLIHQAATTPLRNETEAAKVIWKEFGA
ncbi:aldo/keto reductase [Mycolicibacterium cosmeticum]|uniref:aldo/keto reductase n=1 Tax=Mycolicibacterium cosmeticum TaxID=258533 RepID=UPI003204D412